jgi:hypothetical protein
MTIQDLITQGNTLRSQHQPQQALACYAQAFVNDPDNSSAWNNYGNVMRECGQPERAVPFLQHAILLDPNNSTAKFNLAVAYLAQGNYQQGWAEYEHRWNFEHLAGTLPNYNKPRWRGEDLQGRTIFVVGEQGHGDNIQFVRFLYNLHVMGARIVFATTDGLIPLFSNSAVINQVIRYTDDPGEFDFWCPLMSIPGILGSTLENLPQPVNYITARDDLVVEWQKRLGPKHRMRVGISWSGRTDNWLNEHKGMSFEKVCELVKANPQIEWINLQIDVNTEQSQTLDQLGVRQFPGTIQNFDNTAALIHHLDIVVSVDTAVAHLAAALGRPTWLMLNWFAACWRWLNKRDDSPWYSTMRIFRQPQQDDWNSVIRRVTQYLSWFKV